MKCWISWLYILNNNSIKEDNPKPARKETPKATTMTEFNLKPHLNNDSSEIPKSSSYSNRFQQG